MPFFRRPTAAPQARIEEDLLTPEDVADRRRRHGLWLILLILLLLAATGWFGAKPALHAIKAWQARRSAAEARQLIEAESWSEARNKVMDAIQLWRQEPAAIQVTALFLTRVGHYAEAEAFWRELEKTRRLTASDQRDYATVELELGDVDAAESRLRQAWPAGQAGTPADWLLGMQLALRRNRGADALDLAKRLLASQEITDRQRLNTALVLLSSGSSADQMAAWTQVRSLAAGRKSAESLDALLLLARRAAAAASNPAAADSSSDPNLSTIIAEIEAHPLAKASHRLLALDLRLMQEPAKRTELLQSAMQQYAGGDPADVLALAGWLYAKGEFGKVLEVIPLNVAISNRALFLQYLDTLGALNRWDEIQELVKTQKFPLEPMIQQMYLARCADRLGETAGRDGRWKAALTAAGANLENLLTVGRYAEGNGAAETAEAAFRAAVQANPKSREAHEALISLLESLGRTRDLRDALRAMATLWPLDRAVRNDNAYFDALLGENLPAALDTARELVAAEPASLPHRTALALVELRLGNGLAALDAFAGIGTMGDAAQPRSRAVYAALLWQTSYSREAAQAVREIPRDRLLPEENELIRAIPTDDVSPSAP